eukprot:4576005-Prymnesium_polylepis.1
MTVRGCRTWLCAAAVYMAVRGCRTGLCAAAVCASMRRNYFRLSEAAFAQAPPVFVNLNDAVRVLGGGAFTVLKVSDARSVAPTPSTLHPMVATPLALPA